MQTRRWISFIACLLFFNEGPLTLALAAASKNHQDLKSSLAKRTHGLSPSITLPTLQQQPLSSSSTCTGGSTDVTFEVQTLLDIIGRPSLVSETDLLVLEEGFTVAYNDVQNCPLPGTSRLVDKVSILYNGTHTTESNQSYPSSVNPLCVYQCRRRAAHVSCFCHIC